MSIIEIFELSAYVIDASQSDPAGSVFLSEIRPYVIQVARSPNQIFMSEFRAYMIAGNSTSRPAISTTTAYVIVKQGFGGWFENANSAFTIRQPGIDYGNGAAYSISQSPFSGGYINGSVPFKEDGLSYAKGTMYTIEIP